MKAKLYEEDGLLEKYSRYLMIYVNNAGNNWRAYEVIYLVCMNVLNCSSVKPLLCFKTRCKVNINVIL